MNISHMQYEFPLSKDVRLNIHPCNFKEIFAHKHVTLPIFQRRYCWKKSQFKKYWRDLVKITFLKPQNKHHVGKFMVFETLRKNEIIVLDGQQRVTTTLLIVICIRNKLLQLVKANKDKIQKSKRLKRLLVKNLDIIDKLLFKDDSKEVVKFLPTYIDREVYNKQVFSIKDTNSHEYSGNKVVACRRFFEDKLSCEDYSSIKDVPKLDRLLDALLTRFTVVYCGIDIKYKHKGYSIYQWLFEKSLFAGKLLYNAAPGETHSVSELFKNYILSFFLTLSNAKQESVYMTWYFIESCFKNDNTSFCDYLTKSINSEKWESYEIYKELVALLDTKYLSKANGNEELYPSIVENFLLSLKLNLPMYRVLVHGFVRNVDVKHVRFVREKELLLLIGRYAL